MSSEYRNVLDVANRACQHCEQGRIDEALGFNENSKKAKEISFVIHKLRRAELERNTWRFSIRKAVLRPRDADTMLVAPTPWDVAVTYFPGSIVSHDGSLWISYIPNNLAIEPGTNSDWQLYFGPLTADEYDEDIAYQTGEIVYSAPGDGTARVYLSLQDGNEDDPSAGTAWSATSTYFKNQVVTHSAVAYMSLIDLNKNNTPSAAPDLWDEAATYSIGDEVGASDGVIYESATNGNINNDPISDDGTNWTSTGVLNPWTTVFTGGTGSIKWLQIGGSEFPNGVGLSVISTPYPLGSGPSSQEGTRNMFRLPAGYVKLAPQDPKAGAVSYLGAPSGRDYDQWNFEGDWIVSPLDDSILIFRFAANVADVTQMPSMFCEMWAARVALAVVGTLTQSTAKTSTIAQEYVKFGSEARTINAIETGPVEPATDDYIACRA